MILFNTTSTEYLAKNFAFKRGACVIKKFSDGEIYVKVEEDVVGQEVWVLASTQPPAENLIELFLLLDALQLKKARINLLITYFGYARQDRAETGEALSAQVISKFLNIFSLNKIIIIQAHSKKLHEFLNFENIVPSQLFCKIAQEKDAFIVAPDKGASALAFNVAEYCSAVPLFVTKTRPIHEVVEIETFSGEVTGKNILIVDDMISTGNTIMKVSSMLKERGALDIFAFVIHGVFAPGARENIENCASIKEFYVTNTLPQKETSKIKVVDIGPFLQQIIIKNMGQINGSI